MSLSEYLIGVLFTTLALGSLAFASVRIRCRVMPSSHGALARVAEAVILAALVVALGHVLGIAGLLQRGPVLLGSTLIALVVGWRLPRAPPVSPPDGPSAPAGWQIAAALACCALVIGQWSVPQRDVLRHGLSVGDTLTYHGPISARFAATGRTTRLEFVYGDPVVPFLPSNSELLHAIGMVLFRNDVASPLLNLSWLALALLSAWCLGSRFGVPAASVAGVSLVLASRTLVQTQAGTQYNDVVVVALLLSAGALLMNAEREHGAALVAGAAAALMLGTKVTAIAPAVVLFAGVIWAIPRDRRGRVAVWWLLLAATLALPWYIRNLAHTGNPLPGLPHLGPLSLPSPPLPDEFSVAHYVGQTHLWSSFFAPQLAKYFGSLWSVTIVLGLLGTVLAVAAGRSRMERALGAVAGAVLVAWFFSPRSGGNLDRYPGYFPTTLRYVTPGLALGVVLATVHRYAQLFPAPWLTAGLGIFLLATLPERGVEATVFSALAALAGGGVILARRLPETHRPPRAITVGVALVVGAVGVAGGWRASDRYLRGAYSSPVTAWARDMKGERIATVGEFGSYPLFGRRLSNHVTTIGKRGEAGAFLPVPSCRFWRDALNAGRYRYVVTSPRAVFGTAAHLELGSYFGQARIEEAWTRADPAVSVIGSDPPRGVVAFRISGRLDPAACQPAPG